MRIKLEIKPHWIFQGDGTRGITVRQVARAVADRWPGELGDPKQELTRCEWIYTGKTPATELANGVRQALESQTGEAYDEDTFVIMVEEDYDAYLLKRDGHLEGKKQPEEDSIFAQINALRGISASSPEKPEKPQEGDTRASESRNAPDAAEKADDARTPAAQDAADRIRRGADTRTPVSQDVPDAAGEAARQAEQQEKNLPQEEVRELPQAKEMKNKQTALEQIHHLVGSEDLKRLADEVALTAELIRKNQTQSVFFSQVYLFAVDTGSGFHTALSLYGKLLAETGLFEKDAPLEMMVLPSFSDKELTAKMNNVVSMLQNALDKQRMICIDLTEWIGHTGSKELKKVLMQIFRQNEKCAVVFRIPYVKPAAMDDIVRDLEDIVSVRPVVFAPFREEELRELAGRYLNKHDFDLAEDAWNLFDKRILQEKGNGYFYGVHTVHKVMGDIIRKKELLDAQNGLTDRHIADEAKDMFNLAETQEPRDHLDALRQMVGMEQVTEKLNEIINQIVYARSTNLQNRPTMHMCFVGNPGTGKTTVARILGQALKDRGILRIGDFYEHHGRDLCGEYVGHTAPKTRAICQEAYGSVLFIDEAYSLATDGDHRYDYGKEAIDTLISEMENHGDDLLVIFAGYADEIEKMIALNPGMRSRIPYTLEFPGYSAQELTEIFMKMVNDNFSCTSDLAEHAGQFFQSIPADTLKDKAFGNGRFVRNIYERTWGKAIARSGENNFDSLVLNSQDFEAAAAECMQNKGDSDRKIGFS